MFETLLFAMCVLYYRLILLACFFVEQTLVQNLSTCHGALALLC